MPSPFSLTKSASTSLSNVHSLYMQKCIVSPRTSLGSNQFPPSGPPNPMRIGNPFAFGRTAFFIPARGKKHTNDYRPNPTFHFLCTHLIFGHPAVISAFLLAYFQFLPTYIVLSFEHSPNIIAILPVLRVSKLPKSIFVRLLQP